MGFKEYGQTGILCLSLNNSIIHPIFLRNCEIDMKNYANIYRRKHKYPLVKFEITKKQDTFEFRKGIYGTIQKDINPVNAMLATESMLSEISDYPSELYKYGRSQ